MAKAPKAVDPAKAAIDAVEEALNLDDILGDELDLDDLEESLDSDDLDNYLDSDELDHKSSAIEDKSSSTKSKTQKSDKPRDRAKLASSAKKSPANDDRRAVGKIAYNLQRRPSSTPFLWATLISVVWVLGSAFLGTRYLDVPLSTVVRFDELIPLLNQGPGALWMVATFVPILIFFVSAFLIWRAQELRIAAHSMSEVALRLAEPEDMATEAVTNVSQAVRREVAAMGDGVERVLARAGELEVLVHNEMVSLERSYSDNELRIRTLIDELSTQRDAILNNAERVSTSLESAKRDLTNDLKSVGDEMLSSMTTKGGNLIKELKSTADSASEQLLGTGHMMSDTIKTTNNDVTTSITANLAQQAKMVTESLQSSAATMMVDLSLRSSEITDNIDGIGNKVAELITEKNDAMAANINAVGNRIEDLFNKDGNALASRISESGEGIAKIIENRSISLLSDIENTTDKVHQKFDASHKTINSQMTTIGEEIGEALIARSQDINQQFANSGTALVAKIEEKSANLTGHLDTRLNQIDKVIDEKGTNLANSFGERINQMDYVFAGHTKSISKTIQNEFDQASNSFQIKTQEIADNVAHHVKALDDTLGQQHQQIHDTFASQAQNLTNSLNDQLASSVQTLESQAINVSDKLRDGIEKVNLSLAGNVDQLTTNIDNAVGSLETNASRMNDIVSVDLVQATDKLISNAESAHIRILDISENSNKNFTAAADEAASLFASKTHEAGENLIGALSNLSTGIRAQANDTASQIEDKALQLQVSLESSTSLAERSLEDLDKKTEAVATNIARASSNMVENLQSQTTQIVEALTTQFGDVSTLLDRMTGKNDEIHGVLKSAAENLATIESSLTNRSVEIRNAMTQATGHNEETTKKFSQEIIKLKELTELTIRDTASLASRFDGQSSSLTDAASMLAAAADNMETTVAERQNVIQNLSQGLVAKSADIEKLMGSFADLMDQTVTQAEDRAKLVNHSLATTAEQTSQDITNHIADLHAGTNAQLNAAVQEATERFAHASEQMRVTAQNLQGDLQATRAEIKRGIFELPEETKESTAAMRRLVSDQVRALNDLSDIVSAQRNRKSQSGKPAAPAAAPAAMTQPVQQAQPVQQTQPAQQASRPASRLATRTQPVQADRTEKLAPQQNTPAPRTSEFAGNRQTAQPAAPSSGDDANSGWVTDLLRRASNEPGSTQAGATPAQAQQAPSNQSGRSPEHIVESLYSLSVDIARIIDRDATVELWERYQRGERNVFTRRLRSLEGVQLRDEIRRNFASSSDFADSVKRYIADFEVLMLEVSRRRDGSRQAESYLNSDVGRVYTILAQATGRFD